MRSCQRTRGFEDWVEILGLSGLGGWRWVVGVDAVRFESGLVGADPSTERP